MERMMPGVYCPTITITDENGNIDYEKWGQHLDHLIDAGISGILVFGSIGEFYAFSLEEKKKAVDFAARQVARRVPLYVGVGDTKIERVIEFAQYCEKLDVSGIVVISPYYFGPSALAAETFFTQVAQATQLPVVLYNFPDRTGSDLSPELVAKLAKECPNIVAVKDTVDTISHTRAMISQTPSDFDVFSGFDEYYLVNRISGGSGIISGLTNVEPETFVALHRAYEAGDFAQVVSCGQRVSHLMSIYSATDLFISAIKGAVKAKGLEISTTIAQPAVQLTEEQLRNIEQIIS